MRTIRTLSIAVALGAVLCLEASAGKVIPVYTNEFETQWFDADVGHYTAGQALPEQWTKPTSEDAEVTVGNKKITLDTDFDAPLSYTPAAACSDVAVVAAKMTAAVNVSEPTFDDSPQAALAVIGKSTSTNWIGLVGKESGGTAWVTFTSQVPVAGQECSVRIEFDQRSSERKIRYLVDNVILSDSTKPDGWYPNPSTAGKDISKVSFSGSGDITALSGNNVLNASFDMDDDFGYDFTNGLVTVSNVNVGGAAATAKITVIDCKTGNKVVSTEQSVGGDSVSWDLAAVLEDHALIPGGDYTYEVDIVVGGKVVAKKTDTFLAANWTDDTWFGADAAVAPPGDTFGGGWDPAKTPEVEDNAYIIDDDALFNVTVQDDGTNKVTRVDAVVMFDAFVTNPATPEGDAFGGFVAAKNGDAAAQWMALTTDGWVALTGELTPVPNTTYTVRAEVDFLSENRRVRYFVKGETGDFEPLTYDGSDWIPLVGKASTFTSVELQGSGTLVKFEATIADKALAVVDGEEYDSMEAALAAAKAKGKTIELLTNATVEPTAKGTYEIAPGTHRYVSGGKVSTEPQTIVVTESGQPPVVRPSTEEMNKVKTPEGAQFKDINKLREFLEKNGITAYTGDDANAQGITAALKAVPEGSKNGLELWKDYALGIDKTDSVKPVTTPSGDTAADRITLSIPAIVAATPSGDYSIAYEVVDKTGNPTSDQQETGAIKIPLDTGTYTIKAVFTPVK